MRIFSHMKGGDIKGALLLAARTEAALTKAFESWNRSEETPRGWTDDVPWDKDRMLGFYNADPGRCGTGLRAYASLRLPKLVALSLRSNSDRSYLDTICRDSAIRIRRLPSTSALITLPIDHVNLIEACPGRGTRRG